MPPLHKRHAGDRSRLNPPVAGVTVGQVNSGLEEHHQNERAGTPARRQPNNAERDPVGRSVKRIDGRKESRSRCSGAVLAASREAGCGQSVSRPSSAATSRGSPHVRVGTWTERKARSSVFTTQDAPALSGRFRVQTQVTSNKILCSEKAHDPSRCGLLDRTGMDLIRFLSRQMRERTMLAEYGSGPPRVSSTSTPSYVAVSLMLATRRRASRSLCRGDVDTVLFPVKPVPEQVRFQIYERSFACIFQIYVDLAGQWRWRGRSDGNHKVIADSGEGYVYKVDCRYALDIVKRESTFAPVYER